MNPIKGILTFRGQAQAYYDEATPLYLRHLGRTIQAGRYRFGDSESASNLFFAEAAALSDGEAILDAGCGVCGPAIDIATAYTRATLTCVTISPLQARVAAAFVASEDLHERISTLVADYHSLPLPPDKFDLVIFLESIGYAYDFPKLAREIYRVLRIGGRLYIKDVFLREGLPTDSELQALKDFDNTYHQRTPSFSELARALRRAGFSNIETVDITESVTTQYFLAALGYLPSECEIVPTDLGKMHRSHPLNPRAPVIFGQVRATKTR